MKVLTSTRSSMMRSDLFYITDRRLKRPPFKYTCQLSSSPQRKVSFENNSRSISSIGLKGSGEDKKIGVRYGRRSRAIRIASGPSPSRRTASWSPQARPTRQCGSGTPARECCARRSRAIRLTSRPCPSGTVSQERHYSRSRAHSFRRQ
jgi:hypothetical protein